MYDYLWGMTAQEVELMAIDQPIVVYDHKKRPRKKGEKKEFKKADPFDVIRAGREWQEKYQGKENEPIKIDLGGFGMPTKV